MADITVEDLTNDNSKGVFDKLVSALQVILLEEFKNNRITGTEYSKIFMSSLDSAMNQSMQFLLQKDQVAKQIEVLEAQRLLTIAQTDIAVAQLAITEAELEKLQAEILLIPVQKELLEAQVVLTSEQSDKVINESAILVVEKEKAEFELTMLPAQKELIEAQVVLTEAQASKATVEVEILEIQKTKTTAEVLLVEANTSETNKKVEVLTAQLLNIPKEGLLIDKQVLKAVSETEFLDQRIKTEMAQIVDVIDGTAVHGVIEKQKDLYAEQAKVFTTDAEYKVMKALIETWVTRRGTDEATVVNGENKLSDAFIGAAVNKCFDSLGIPTP